MQGLDLPDAIYSGNVATPFPFPTIQVNGNEIPIDPLLGGPVIEPVVLTQESKVESPDSPSVPEPIEQPLHYSEPLRQYSQGPQGDPFAPPPPPYMPIAIEQSPTPKAGTNKKKRKTRKPGHCGTCDGNDTKNKNREPEVMVTCIECARKDHPSCISAEVVGDVVRSYEWRCSDCKICEVCLSKGDEAKMVFCDHCDRGWHQDCLDPPLEETPKGKWHCPKCPPLEFEVPVLDDDSISDSILAEQIVGFDDSIRASSPASSSRKRSTAPFSLFSEESEVEVVKTPAKRTAKRSYKKKAPAVKEESVVSSDHETATTPLPARQSRSKRQRAQSPDRPLPRVRLRLSGQKGKGKEREPPESPKGVFDDILGVEERDTTRTTVIAWDKQQFDRSRQLAEEKLAPPSLPSEVPSTPVAGPSRPLRSAALQHVSIPSPALSLGSPSPSTPGAKVPAYPPIHPESLRIRTIRFGQFDIKTWYDAPFPEEYSSIPDGRLWICEFCLKYMKSRLTAGRHKLKCKARHPPGDEIYRDGAISIFEVDGRKNKIYCQNLCLLSKMFLDHKSLFYDVEPFLFYVITETDEFGARFVGYFSKEKRCSKDYNLSCIMTLPVRQRQGWGNLLIDFSYLLSKKEKRAGSPEKPLSALGAIGYRNYWTLAVMRFLENASDNLRLDDISHGTGMTFEDIYNTLLQQSMITVSDTTPPSVRPSPGQSIKYPKGRKSGIARRALQRTQTQDEETSGPFVPPKSYRIHWDRGSVSLYLSNWRAKGYLQLKPERLKWTPFLISRAEKQLLHREEATQSFENETKASSGTPRGETGQAGTPSSIGHTAAGIEDSLPVPSSSSRASGPEDRSLSVDIDRPLSSPSRSPTPPIISRRRTRSQITTSSRRSTSIATPHIRPSRSTSRIILSPTPNDTLADDEALAAQLQDEEQRPKRQLRSRQNSSQHVQRLVSTPLRTSLKRKRIESSPESEDAEDMHPTATLSVSPLPNGHHQPLESSHTLSRSHPSPVPNGNSDPSLGMHIVNGRQPVNCTPSELDIAALLVSMNNSVPSPHAPPPATGHLNCTTDANARTPTPSTSIHSDRPPYSNRFTRSPSVSLYLNGTHLNGTVDPSSDPVMHHAESPKAAEPHDTLDYAMVVDTFNSSPTAHGSVKSGDAMDSTAKLQIIVDGPFHSNAPVSRGGLVSVESADEYGDEDADGEYEEDAEGELDEELFGATDSTTPM